MRLAFAAFASPSFAGKLLDADAFEALAEGRTLTHGLDSQPSRGHERHHSGLRVT